MRWRERCLSRTVRLPATIEEHPTFASERAVQVGPAEVRSNDMQRDGAISDANVRNVFCSKRGTLGLTHNELQRVRAEDVLFE